jgi:peptidoglycan/xylan/chitin deacetylase (PgdA/CDA1 family)
VVRRIAAIATVVLAAAAVTIGVLGVLGVFTSRRQPVRHAVHVTSRQPRKRRLNMRIALAVERIASADLPVYCGGRRGRDVALTFDDGPGTYTHLALRILRNAHARATFFLVGRNLAPWHGSIRKELLLGGVGDHTWTHAYLPKLSPATVTSELATTKQAIDRRGGVRIQLFRPPYGAQTKQINTIGDRLGLLDVLWSVDSLDWKGANWQQIATNVVSRLRPGSIVLMHENRGQTIRALRYLILPVLRERRWKLVSVAELLQHDPPTLQQLHRGLAGCQ